MNKHKLVQFFVVIIIIVGFYVLIYTRNASSEVGTAVNLTGKLEIIVKDTFREEPTHKNEYFIRLGNGTKYELYPNDVRVLESNSTIQVNGILTDGSIKGDVTVVARNQPYPDLSEVGFHLPYEILVLMLNPAGSQVPISKADVETHIFNGPVQNFYKENSYNRRYLTGNVYGWINLDLSNVCNSPSVANLSLPEVKNYILSNNIDLHNYKHVLFVNNCGDDDGVSTIGQSAVNFEGETYSLSLTSVAVGPLALTVENLGLNLIQPFTWYIFDRLVTHELGHAFGLWHANGLDCDAISIGTNCKHLEYRNPFDAMGTGIGYALHFHGQAKDELGWLQTSEVLNINSSGTYTLSPLEVYGGYKYANIYNPALSSSEPVYTLESRKPIGFDAALGAYPFLANIQNGLIVGQYSPSSSNGVRVIDALATTADWWTDMQNPVIANQNILDDSGRGITIGPIISSNSSGVTFSVTINPNIPACVHVSPGVVQYAPYVYSNASSGNFDLKVKVINNDPPACGSSKFYTKMEFPQALVYDQPWQSYSYNLTPLDVPVDETVSTLFVPNIPPGDYNFTITTINEDFPNIQTVQNAVLTVTQ